MTWIEVVDLLNGLAPGFNMVAVVGAMAAGLVFAGLLGDELRKPPEERQPSAVYYFALIATGMALSVIWRGYWQLYYTAVALDAPDWAAWFIKHQAFSTLIAGMTGLVFMLHVKYRVRRWFGRRWLLYVLAGALAAFLVGAGLPVVAG